MHLGMIIPERCLVKLMITAALLFSAALGASARAQSDDVVVKAWMVRQMVISYSVEPFDIKTAEVRMRSIYAALSKEEWSMDNGLSRVRAQIIARFLNDDLDNDGNLTSAELRQKLMQRASRPLTVATGLQIDPTKEQSEIILRYLITKELAADRNRDGKIDFAEMRQHAAEEALNTYGTPPPSLHDKTVIRVLDTSGDGAISEAEFIDGARRIFAIVDANNDGKISRAEAVIHTRYQSNTF